MKNRNAARGEGPCPYYLVQTATRPKHKATMIKNLKQAGTIKYEPPK